MNLTKYSSFKSDNFVIVDSHVHFHDCFKLESVFDRTLQNFVQVSAKIGEEYSSNGILLLCESKDVNYFSSFHNFAQGIKRPESLESWNFFPTGETASIFVSRNAKEGFYILAGRQIITAENLEVLALNTSKKFDDQLPVRETLIKIVESGAIPVIPWGVGKWFGKRGKLLKQLLQGNKIDFLFLGDNSGRPVFWPKPSLFKLATRNGLKILPGSDPLPFPSEYSRPGIFGFIAEGTVSPQSPGASIKSILRGLRDSPLSYGNLEMPFRFFKHQILMQINKYK